MNTTKEITNQKIRFEMNYHSQTMTFNSMWQNNKFQVPSNLNEKSNENEYENIKKESEENNQNEENTNLE